MSKKKFNKKINPAEEPSVKAPAAEAAAQNAAEPELVIPTEPQAEAVREEKELENPTVYASAESDTPIDDGETPLDKNVKLMSPGRMVARRFFRSKLSLVGLIMVVGILLFCWFGPVVYTRWGETTQDYDGKVTYSQVPVTITEDDGTTYTYYKIIEIHSGVNRQAAPDGRHILGTDEAAMDIFVRLMYGGRRSLSISFIAVFAIAIVGIIFGGIAGYFGGWVDNLIMRICDILMCLPGLPILLIIGTLLEGLGIASANRMYFLMIFLTVFSWSGTARLVRGQLLFLREQEYMVAAEAMGFSVGRKIFKHLVPNVMPQLIVSMSMSLGSMILYESSLSYLGLGVMPPYASWGAMVNATNNPEILRDCFWIWGPPGICIIIAVLGFNFLGDGLRDALDPKMRR